MIISCISIRIIVTTTILSILILVIPRRLILFLDILACMVVLWFCSGLVFVLFVSWFAILFFFCFVLGVSRCFLGGLLRCFSALGL